MIESSDLLARTGVLHGFSTLRAGTMGQGLDNGDGEIVENRRRLMAQLGVARLVEVKQVHGDRVITARGCEALDRGEPAQEADAIVSTTPGIAVGVRTADCAPVLIAAVSEGVVTAVAAVHAGWRGATKGILNLAVDALLAEGAAQDDLHFAIGPAIGLDAFEVGNEVIDAARASLGGETPPMRHDPGGPHLDLRGLLIAQLQRMKIAERRIELVGGCTASDPDRYFSHRRDQGRTGRHLSLIALPAS